MQQKDSFIDKLSAFWTVAKPKVQKTIAVIKKICSWIYRLRGPLLSAPIAVAAIYLAVKSNQTLPDLVGINLLETGAFSKMISKELAIWVPLGITGGCLVLTCCSRRVVYPWLIALFTLVIPLLLLLTNTISL